ncbi:MAG: ATP-binding protein [Bacteroides sp.]|nr:ATP-binding protein [Bacteroides sp.]
MIEEISFKNILSFKDDTQLSFEATADTSIESSHVVTMPNGTRLLKLAIILGANASGKSNLLFALETLHKFWTDNPTNMDTPIGIEPFLLDRHSASEPSEFSLKIWIDGIKYWYQLVLTDRVVAYEKLSFYKTVQPVMIFERKMESAQSVIRVNPAVQRIDQETLKILSLNCLPNMSVFAARARINMRFEYVDQMRAWINNGFMPTIYPATNMTAYARKVLTENLDFKSHMIDFLTTADFNISGMEEISNNQGQKKFSFLHTVRNQNGLEHYQMSLDHQSEGTRRLLGVEAAVYDLIHKGSFLMVDEMDSSLHPDLMEYILRQFLLESTDSQLLITTHYDGILRKIDDLIRKDNIWFTEKDNAGISHLYSLVEFKGLNKITHIDRAYRNGMFGAIPEMKA